MPEVRNRYCGSKYLHDAHTWQQIGRADGPWYACPGKQRVASEVQLRAALRDAIQTMSNARRADVWEIVNKLVGLARDEEAPREAQPSTE